MNTWRWRLPLALPLVYLVLMLVPACRTFLAGRAADAMFFVYVGSWPSSLLSLQVAMSFGFKSNALLLLSTILFLGSVQYFLVGMFIAWLLAHRKT